MPRGVPKAGFRKMTKKAGRPATKTFAYAMPVAPLPPTKETDSQIDLKLTERFDALDCLTQSCLSGHSRALIISGPGGLGKSFNVEKILKEWDPEEKNHTISKGFVAATGLYKLLYAYRAKNKVLVFDDADAIFKDPICLSLLKAVCDTTETRKVSWLNETRMVDEESGELMPRQFVFNGTIIFISNIDFQAAIDKGSNLAPHLEAMLTRSHYIDLAMKTRRDYIVRIRQVVKLGLLNHLSAIERKDVVDYIEKNQESLRELSLRMAIKIGSLRASSPSNWQKLVKVTCCKGL